MDDDDSKNVPEAHLAALAPRFLAAIQKRSAGQVDAALEAFADILKTEPRIAEPRMEIARIYLEMGRLDDAEAEAREAIRILELGGQWTEDLPEHVVLAVAWALYGEILKEKASSDEVVFGDPVVFTGLIEQSRAAFARAAELDPSDRNSAVTAMELGDRADDADDEEPEPEPDN